MTTLIAIDGNVGESRSNAVARRLRAELAAKQLSVSEVARRLGRTQQSLSRRMTGQTSWDLNDLDDVCQAAGISFDYVATGIREVPTPEPQSPLRGSNSGHLAYKRNRLPAHTLFLVPAA